jgi:uncharacterized protein
MNERILEELARIERQQDVRVLLAVESGSRAWGFASPDSDYDVRFVYAHRRDWYLSVFEQRDVIEEMLEGDLDVSGWDLRKTLRLFAKCNPALNEWLGSPIVYAQVPQFKAQLAALIPGYFNPLAVLHHYRRMAENAFKTNSQSGRIRIKKLFYVLRPLLACRWIARVESQPPTAFAKLLDQPWVVDEERCWIEELLARKAAAAESELVELASGRVDSLQREIESYKSIDSPLKPPSSERNSDELDALLRSWAT